MLGAVVGVEGGFAGPGRQDVLPQESVQLRMRAGCQTFGPDAVAQSVEGGLESEEEVGEHGAEIEGLAEDEEVGGCHQGDDFAGLESVARGDERERVDGLVVHFGGLHVAADGVGEEGEFGHVGGHAGVDAFAGVGEAGLVGGEVGGEAVVEHGVDDLGALREQQFPDHLQRQPRFLHGGGDRGGLEVAAMVDVVSGNVYQGVVGGGV